MTPTSSPSASPSPSPSPMPGAGANAALLAAAGSGDTDAVRAALARHAQVETRDQHRRTPLLLAALGDHVEAAKLLVAAGADPDAQDDRRDSAFLVTGVTGSVAMLDVLLPATPDPTLTNRFGGVSVIPASERGHADYVAAVLDRTAMDVNHVNNLGYTALLEAVLYGDGGEAHQRIVATLLDHGADPKLADRTGTTPLGHATAAGQTAVAAILRGATG